MNIFLTLAFLFFIGATLGWVLELLFRRFFSSANPERKWINPGFCVGPYLPLYGCGLCFLYLIASLEQFSIIRDPFWNRVVLFLIMAVCMTVTEYFAGLIALKGFHVRLWDYSKQWGNIQGLICPKFSLAWAILGAAYYFLIHPRILHAIDWLSRNLAFSFVIGLFTACSSSTSSTPRSSSTVSRSSQMRMRLSSSMKTSRHTSAACTTAPRRRQASSSHCARSTP